MKSEGTRPDSAERLREWLREARRAIAFCGAGVSAESGVPTFRGAGGLWEGSRVEDVATPEAFERDPRLVWGFYSRRQEALRHVEPNPAHHALAAMERRYDDFLLVTQNVDNLHERAGSEKLIKLHGSLMETRCVQCERVRPLSEPVSSRQVDAGELPLCRCGGLLRPNVVWFGEQLNVGYFEEIAAFFRACPIPVGTAGRGVLLVIGTSGAVGDGYGITEMARRYGVRSVEINPEPTVLSDEVDLVVRAPAGKVLGAIGMIDE